MMMRVPLFRWLALAAVTGGAEEVAGFVIAAVGRVQEFTQVCSSAGRAALHTWPPLKSGSWQCRSGSTLPAFGNTCSRFACSRLFHMHCAGLCAVQLQMSLLWTSVCAGCCRSTSAGALVVDS